MKSRTATCPSPSTSGSSGLVDQLVDPAGLEAGGNVDVRVRRHDGALGALIVETAAAFDAGELPVLGGHGDASIGRVAPARQAGLGGVARYGWMAAGRDPAAQRIRRNARLIGDELDAHRPGHRPAVVGGDGQVEDLPPIAGKQVALPGEPGDRVAAPHQEAVAGVGQTPRVVGAGRIVEELQAALVAAVGPVEEQPPVAGLHVDRLQQQEIGRELHEPARIPRRLVDVDDGRLRLAGGVHREAHPAGDPLVGASGPEGFPIGEGCALDHRQLQAIGHGLTAPLISWYPAHRLMRTRYALRLIPTVAREQRSATSEQSILWPNRAACKCGRCRNGYDRPWRSRHAQLCQSTRLNDSRQSR